MCLPSILWTFILFYVPLFRSMGRCSILCAVVLVYVPSYQSMDRHPRSMDRCHFSLLHQFQFRPMCLPSILWTSILFYGPSSRSMGRCSILCAVVLVYVPSYQSMDRHPRSMDRFHFSILHQFHFRPMCLPSILWASILFYVPSFRSMDLYPVLWTFILLYVPSSRSMCHHSALCAVAPIYGPSATFYVPTTTTITTKKPNDDCSTNRHSVLTTRASLHRSTLSSLSTHSICLSLRLRLVLCNRGCRRLQMSCRPDGRLEKVQPNACRQHAIYQHDRRCIVASCFASGSPS